MKHVALIPLRGGSKSIHLKNIKELSAKPLCYWVIKAAQEADIFNQVIVSTDSKEIKEVVLSYFPDLYIVDRPAEFATDTATTESVMQHLATLMDFDILTTIQATSPLTEGKHLVEAYQQFKKEQLDSLLTAVRVKRFFWDSSAEVLNYNYSQRPRRQEFEGTFMENGAFYITKRKILISCNNRLGGKIGIYEMSERHSIELDELAHWFLVEREMEKLKK